MWSNSQRSSYAATLVVENKPGAGGRIGLEYLRGTDADGSSMILTPASMIVIYPWVYKKLSYDPFRECVPVARVCKFSYAITVGPAVPAGVKTIPDFVQWYKANPKQASYAIAAAGSGTHVAGVMLARASGVEMTSVAYKGGAPTIQEVIGGQIASSVSVLGEAMPFAAAGKLRILGTTRPTRSRFVPDVPAVKETYPDYVADEWFGMFMPASPEPHLLP